MVRVQSVPASHLTVSLHLWRLSLTSWSATSHLKPSTILGRTPLHRWGRTYRETGREGTEEKSINTRLSLTSQWESIGLQQEHEIKGMNQTLVNFAKKDSQCECDEPVPVV